MPSSLTPPSLTCATRPGRWWLLLLPLLMTTGPTLAQDLPGRGRQAAGCAAPPGSPLKVDVRDRGAVGDGRHDDTDALQAAIDEVGGTGGTVQVPEGVYLVDALRSVHLRSHMTLKMADGAVLRAIPNDQGHSAVLLLQSVADVNIVGGVIEGERAGHLGSDGEWGMGLSILASQRVAVDGVTARDCWGDGFYIGDAGSRDITVCRVLADHNRRQGMSITQGKRLVVRDSVFQRTAGTEPEAGLDIEPDRGDTVDDVQVLRNVFRDNAGGGLQIGPAVADRRVTFVTGVRVEDNDVVGNGVGALSPPSYAILLQASAGNQLRGNRVRDNVGIGIGVVSTQDALIEGNSVTGTAASGDWVESGAGIILEQDQGSRCIGNKVAHNAGHGIFTWRSDARLRDNRVFDNGLKP